MINNCFNYIGSKDRVFRLLDVNMDKSKKHFIDLFCGSGVVGINEVPNYSSIILNDLCWQLVETLRCLRDHDGDTLLSSLDAIINEFSLSSSNKKGYLELRELFNTSFCKKDVFNPYMFYCLVVHSFNYSIHINSSNGFSVPFGKNRSSFNKSLRTKFELFQKEIHSHKNKIFLKNKEFSNLIKEAGDKIISNSMIYCDPPYLSSDSSYGRIHYIGKWDTKKEQLLLSCLDYVNEKGGSFLLSNVLENNGVENILLKEWSKKYNVIDISADYSSCNYQRKNLGKTKEVLVRNY